MAQVAVQLGVPREAILLETKSRSTFENAAFCRNFLASRQMTVQSALLVSSPWHMGRVVRIMKTGFDNVRFYCCPHDESCTHETWAQTPEGRIIVEHEAFLLGEWISRGVLPEQL